MHLGLQLGKEMDARERGGGIETPYGPTRYSLVTACAGSWEPVSSSKFHMDEQPEIMKG